MDTVTLNEEAVRALLLANPFEMISSYCLADTALETICSDDTFWKQLIARDYPGVSIDPSVSYMENYMFFRRRGLRQIPIIYQGRLLDHIWVEQSDIASQVLREANRRFTQEYPNIRRYLLYVIISPDQRDKGAGTYLLSIDRSITTNVTFVTTFNDATSIDVSDYIKPGQEDNYPDTPPPTESLIDEVVSAPKFSLGGDDEGPLFGDSDSVEVSMNPDIKVGDLSDADPVSNRDFFIKDEFEPDDFVGVDLGVTESNRVGTDILYSPQSKWLQERRDYRKSGIKPRSWFDFDSDHMDYSLRDDWLDAE